MPCTANKKWKGSTPRVTEDLEKPGVNPLLDCLSKRSALRDYLDALGLTVFSGGVTTSNHPHFFHNDVQRLYADISEAVAAQNKLLANCPDLRSEFTRPNCFKQDAQSLITRHGFIWGDDDCRRAHNELRISQPKDKTTIETILRCIIGKRIYYSFKHKKDRVYKEKVRQREAAPALAMHSVRAPLDESKAISYSPASMAAHSDVEESERDDSASDLNPNTELSSSIWDKRSEPRLKRMRSGMLKTQQAFSPIGSVTPTPEEEDLANTCLELLKQPSISPISPPSHTEFSYDNLGKDASLDYAHTTPVPEKEEEIPVHDPAYARDDQDPFKDLNEEEETLVHDPAHARGDEDLFKDLNEEEETLVHDPAHARGDEDLFKDLNEETEIPVQEPAHAGDDQHSFKDLNLENEIPVPEPAHASDDRDPSSDLTPEEKEKHLQTVAFDELVEVLQISNPQHSTLSKLEPYADTLYTPKTYERMSIALGPAFDKAYEAMQLWHAIHRKLKEFRETTKYEGKAGADWQAYKQALRSVSWKESLPAMTAHRQLGLFVEEMKKRGEWFASSEGFADDLARFYAALLLPPNISAEDLVGGFEEYNVELLKWFEVGGG